MSADERKKAAGSSGAAKGEAGKRLPPPLSLIEKIRKAYYMNGGDQRLELAIIESGTDRHLIVRARGGAMVASHLIRPEDTDEDLIAMGERISKRWPDPR